MGIITEGKGVEKRRVLENLLPLSVLVGAVGLGAYLLPPVSNRLEVRTASKNVTALKPITYELTQHPADQVFRNHNGYLVRYADESGKDHELKYWESWGSNPPCPDVVVAPPLRECDVKESISVYHDLAPGERGFAATHAYRVDGWALGWKWRPDQQLTRTEIHLPKNQALNAGSETYGGKYKTHEMMHEIK